MRNATRLMLMGDEYDRSQNEQKPMSRGGVEPGRAGEYDRKHDPLESKGMRDKNRRPYDQDSDYPDDRQRMGYSQTHKKRGGKKGSMDEEDDEEEEDLKHHPKKWDEDEETHKKTAQIDEKTARRWVEKMHNEDGSHGEHFPAVKCESLRSAHCPTCQKWEWYVALNMMYSDYVLVGQAMGMDRDDFYAQLAKAFLCDEDAEEGKLMNYMENIPKKKQGKYGGNV